MIIFGAKYLYLFIIAIAGIYFLMQSKDRKREIFVLSVVYLPFTYIIAKIISRFYFNSRPFVVDNFQPLIQHIADNGFPSDHMLLSSSIASILTIYNKKIGLLAWIMAFFVGLSRVSAGIHHWADIFGSAFIAILIIFFVYRYVRPYLNRMVYSK